MLKYNVSESSLLFSLIGLLADRKKKKKRNAKNIVFSGFSKTSGGADRPPGSGADRRQVLALLPGPAEKSTYKSNNPAATLDVNPHRRVISPDFWKTESATKLLQQSRRRAGSRGTRGREK